LVGSTALAEQLDPEEFHHIVRAYQDACADIISRFDGYIAQYLGDGLLVYFGYPGAHEDDAQRAVRTGLEIMAALPQLSARLRHRVHARVGIHTGPVVVGEIGGGARREHIALGETPNIAARLQGLAGTDEVLISAATYQLVADFFEYQPLGPQRIKGLSTPLSLYRVVGESSVHSRFEVSLKTGLTPLVGREEERALLLQCWEKAKRGEGQVVLLSGEPGIGKSRLVQELKEWVKKEGHTHLTVPSGHRIEYRCSPVHRNSTFYPVIDLLRRVLRFRREDSPEDKVGKLEGLLQAYHLPLQEAVPLFAALLSLPQPDHYPPLNMSPQRQKHRLKELLIAWLLEEAGQRSVLLAWEDLQWADPSTLELLHLMIEQVPATRVLMVLTFRPEFLPSWGRRPYIIEVPLNRLAQAQVEEMVEKVAGGRRVPAEVAQQIVSKTDGVPLFVEELTKMIMESGLLAKVGDRYELTGPLPSLAIPASLQDSLMARLDRFATVREVAQIGAMLGREFSYELIRAVARFDDEALRQGLSQLVKAELLYQRGQPPQFRYIFKHALIQDAAYQSLLKSTRYHYHQRIAHVLEDQFPDIAESQPELVAHHYTEAGLLAQALPYWQRAGQRAIARSANSEAINHLLKGLQLLGGLPETSARDQHELALQVSLGAPLMATKGLAAPEVEQAYARARELCQSVGDTPQLFPVLVGLHVFYTAKGALHLGYELAQQCFRLAQRAQDRALLLEAYTYLGDSLYWMGDLTAARDSLERAIALYHPQHHRSHAFVYGQDPWVLAKSELSWALWVLGYPDQALSHSQEVLARVREVAHAHSHAIALWFAIFLRGARGEWQTAHTLTEEMIALALEQDLPLWSALGTFARGLLRARQGQHHEGMRLMRQGYDAYRFTGGELGLPWTLYMMAEMCGHAQEIEEGFRVLDEAFAMVRRNGELVWEAELYRLKGQLTLQKLSVAGRQPAVANPQSLTPDPQAAAEACFLQAIDVARRKGTKSPELRATTSLARLLHRQGKTEEAYQMLAQIYGWFTEGFDSQDLRDAAVLLGALGGNSQGKPHKGLSR
jgi:class 3 adenylate cyclase/tetratricopeptide (TPR) repeat protein